MCFGLNLGLFGLRGNPGYGDLAEILAVAVVGHKGYNRAHVKDMRPVGLHVHR